VSKKSVNVPLLIGQLPKRRLTSAAFFLKGELFFNAPYGRKKSGCDFFQKRSAP
jgi:hypothetical protein